MAESLRFSPGDKQQEMAHLHFQRPALSASPPPRRLRSKALPSGTVTGGGVPEGEAPIGFPRPQPPPLLQHTPPTRRAGLEAEPLATKFRDSGTARASIPKWGDKMGDPPLWLDYQRMTGGGRGGSPEAEWAVKGGLGSFLAPVRRQNSGHYSQSEASCPPWPRSPGLQRRSGSSTRLQPLALPSSGSSRGHHCGSRTPHPEAGGGGGGWASAGTVVRDAPEAQGPQRPVTSIPGALPGRLLGPGTASLRQPGKDNGGRKEESRPPLAIAALSSRAAPALAPTRPSPRLGSKPENKLMFGREERARPGGQAAPGCRRERCCVMVPTWTPAFCPFSLWKSRRAPEPRKADLRVQKPHNQMGTKP